MWYAWSASLSELIQQKVEHEALSCAASLSGPAVSLRWQSILYYMGILLNASCETAEDAVTLLRYASFKGDGCKALGASFLGLCNRLSTRAHP